jgi:hypothetical protein
MQDKSDFPIITVSSARRRTLTRREILQRLGGSLGAFVSMPFVEAHPVYRHLVDPSVLEAATTRISNEDWKPQVLSVSQNEALVVISECMVPGSTKAQVNRVIDVLLTVEVAENRQIFNAALAALEAESKRRFSLPVSSLEEAQRGELLSTCASQPPRHPPQHDDSAASWKTNQTIPANGPANLRDHFEILKGWIVATYYSSEQGMRELGWTDEFYFEAPEECSHPEGHQ